MGRAHLTYPHLWHIYIMAGAAFSMPRDTGEGEKAVLRKLAGGTLLLALLLTGCGDRQQQAQQQGVLLRGRYQSMAGWQGTFQVCAQLGEQAYEFALRGSGRQDGETVLTVTQPDWMAGVTARMGQDEAVLEYDGAGMSLGALNAQGLSPIAALPAMLEQVSQGYIARCSWQREGQETLLELFCRDPEREAGEGTEYVMWFQPDTYALRGGEIQVDGVTVLTITCDDFTMEMKNDESTDHEDLGGDPSGPSGA